jgi:hypothetical protein
VARKRKRKQSPGSKQLLRWCPNTVWSVCLSADGRWALSGSEDKTLRLWNLHTGECQQVLEGHMDSVNSVALSMDSRWVLSGGGADTLRVWELDWEFEAREPIDWNEGARCHIRNFLTIHTPYAIEVQRDHKTMAQNALTRRGVPSWNEQDFQNLLYTLACAGYGWLRPEGVRRELDAMAAIWQGPVPLNHGI